MNRLSVILPTYNEKGNIGSLIKAVSQSVAPAPEIVVVDDSSPDGTGDIVQELHHRRQFPNFSLRKGT